MKAWLFQRPESVAKLGSKAPWSVGWYDHDGRRREKQVGNKTTADKFRVKKESELANAASGSIKRTWKEFRSEYETQILAGLSPATGTVYRNALNQFEEIVKPKTVDTITERSVDLYISKRRDGQGAKRGDKTSPATINKELRTLKRVFHVAKRWRYLVEVPRVEFVREPDKLPRFVTAAHFEAIYAACGGAVRPSGLPYSATTWWQAFLIFQYMTGWRMGEPLRLLRSDVDLDTGFAITRHDSNKGKRDERVPLHPLVIDHLQDLKSFHAELFPWPHSERSLWTEFHRIQRLAGVHLDCPVSHEHSDTCHVYGFHDLRRAFATINAGALSASELQTLMRHRTYTTTQKYINMAAQLNTVTDRLAVPAIDRRNRGGENVG